MITKYDLDKLRSLPIEGVAHRLGLTVVRHVSLCPFHDDRHPSLHFNVSRNTYKCYVCDAHGGTIDLVMNHLHLSFVEACKWLAENEGLGTMVESLGNFPHPSSLTPQPDKSYRFDASRYARYFEHPYLNDAARRFLFDDRHLDPRVVRWCRLTSWRDKQGVPWLQTPYFDRSGKLIGIQNRNLAFPQPSSLNPQPRFRFPSGSACNIYNLQILNRLSPGEPLYIAEGCSDCWSLLSSGHKAIAIPSATTLHQSEILKVFKMVKELGSGNPSSLNSHPSTLHMFPDQDIPGEKLYMQLTLLATQADLCLVRHSLPADCKDYSNFYIKSLNPQPGTIPHPSSLNPHPSTFKDVKC